MISIHGKTIKRIHVNQHVIKSNAKNFEDEPVLTVKSRHGNDYGHTVIIKDARGGEVARVVYAPDDPLSCGARVWIETKEEVQVLDRAETA